MSKRNLNPIYDFFFPLKLLFFVSSNNIKLCLQNLKKMKSESELQSFTLKFISHLEIISNSFKALFGFLKKKIFCIIY